MFFRIVYLLFILGFTINYCEAQNRNFFTGVTLGVGNSGFKILEEGEDDLQRIYYPMAGLHIQKRINDNWAIHFFPNVGMSGNDRVLKTPQNNITKIGTRSAFLNLAIHPKYYINNHFYCSAGPEVSYLIRNSGRTYNGDTRLTSLNETRFFNRVNLLVSSAIGYSIKVQESRRNAPVQVDVLWFIELRLKKGITNILSKDFFPSDDLNSNIFSIELATGICISSKN